MFLRLVHYLKLIFISVWGFQYTIAMLLSVKTIYWFDNKVHI